MSCPMLRYYVEECMYATVENVADGFRPITEEETKQCEALIKEAGIIIDTYNEKAVPDKKRLVTCRMVRRTLEENAGRNGNSYLPIGATQGSISAMGYSQSWTLQGATGELYLSRLEKKILGLGNKVGYTNPLGVSND